MSRTATGMAGRLLLSIGLLGTGATTSVAQLTPPGLSGTETVGWVAVGFTQSVSTRWTVSGYAGTSGQSALGSYVFWKKRAISIAENE